MDEPGWSWKWRIIKQPRWRIIGCRRVTPAGRRPRRIRSVFLFFFFSLMKMALDFWSKHLLLLLAIGNPRMWPRNPWQPPIQGLRMSGSGAEAAVSRKNPNKGEETRDPPVAPSVTDQCLHPKRRRFQKRQPLHGYIIAIITCLKTFKRKKINLS